MQCASLPMVQALSWTIDSGRTALIPWSLAMLLLQHAFDMSDWMSLCLGVLLWTYDHCEGSEFFAIRSRIEAVAQERGPIPREREYCCPGKQETDS